MKPLIVLLIVLLSLITPAQAQTIAEAARVERERQAKLKPTRAITAEGTAPAAKVAKPDDATSADSKSAETAPAAADKAAGSEKPVANGPVSADSPTRKPPAADPLKEFSAQQDMLRARILELQDQETALQLGMNALLNQIFAPVIDPASKDQIQARLGETQQQLAAVRAELDRTKKTLDAMQLQGPKP